MLNAFFLNRLYIHNANKYINNHELHINIHTNIPQHMVYML